ncbi:unnamed protein product [Amoebophrya sp. A25]|nr:unnamed protein product [Amoebophrya sp. A25]|eukprot:GSA25T00001238001.1
MVLFHGLLKEDAVMDFINTKNSSKPKPDDGEHQKCHLLLLLITCFQRFLPKYSEEAVSFCATQLQIRLMIMEKATLATTARQRNKEVDEQHVRVDDDEATTTTAIFLNTKADQGDQIHIGQDEPKGETMGAQKTKPKLFDFDIGHGALGREMKTKKPKLFDFEFDTWQGHNHIHKTLVHLGEQQESVVMPSEKPQDQPPRFNADQMRALSELEKDSSSASISEVGGGRAFACDSTKERKGIEVMASIRKRNRIEELQPPKGGSGKKTNVVHQTVEYHSKSGIITSVPDRMSHDGGGSGSSGECEAGVQQSPSQYLDVVGGAQEHRRLSLHSHPARRRLTLRDARLSQLQARRRVQEAKAMNAKQAQRRQKRARLLQKREVAKDYRERNIVATRDLPWTAVPTARWRVRRRVLLEKTMRQIKRDPGERRRSRGSPGERRKSRRTTIGEDSSTRLFGNETTRRTSNACATLEAMLTFFHGPSFLRDVTEFTQVAGSKFPHLCRLLLEMLSRLKMDAKATSRHEIACTALQKYASNIAQSI